MKTNTPVKRPAVKTHEGAPAVRINAEQQLRRSLMSCLLWEQEFYEDGKSISDRLAELVPQVHPGTVGMIAIEAREKMKLRHAPLFIVREMARHASHRPFVASALAGVIQRADELAEFLAMYWKDGKVPIAHCVRNGLDIAIRKFDEYALAKYDREGAVKLRDVLRVIHPMPENEEQSALWKRAVAGELATPDTWEVELSRNDGVSKLDKWVRLLTAKKLGALALLRNLRNMEQAGVSKYLVAEAIRDMSTYRVLPFRFIAAERFAPNLSDILEGKMLLMLSEIKKLAGKTVILVDVSGSMDAQLSEKSDMTRLDAACGVAIVGRELCGQVEIYSFSQNVVSVPNRRGFGLRDAVVKSQAHGGTYLGSAILKLNEKGYDRLIVITDEQSHDKVGAPVKGSKGYMINVASNQNGVGYGAWTHIDGMSEAVFNWMVEIEPEL
jgi:60 kDa SS-A/Ro ribonucleoprotein